VLRDPREKDEELPELPPHRAELAVVPQPWRNSFLQAAKRIQDQLHSVNPAMAAVLDLWHSSFK